MSSVVSAVEVVLSIFIMISVGMLLTHIGWIKEAEGKFISRFVIRVALPATIVSNIFQKFTRESLISIPLGLVIPVISLILTMLCAIAFSNGMNIPRNRKGAFVVMFTFSNAVFIGLPVCKALFGEDAVAPTLTYYIANTTLFWTIGYSMMRLDGGQGKEKKNFKGIVPFLFSRYKQNPVHQEARNALSFLNKVIPLPLLFLLASIIGVLLNITLPSFIMSSVNYIGGTVTPFSLVYTGYVLMNMIKRRNFSWKSGYAVICFGKLLLVPSIVIALSMIVKTIPGAQNIYTDIMLKTFLIEAAMPIMTQTTIVEAGCGGDAEYVAGATALTTALSLVFIPLYMLVIGLVF